MLIVKFSGMQFVFTKGYYLMLQHLSCIYHSYRVSCKKNFYHESISIPQRL